MANFPLKRVGENGVLAAGDFGGAWFDNGKLVGINLFTFKLDSAAALPDYGFSSNNNGTPYFGSGALDLTNADVQNFIKVNTVPEPVSMLALAAGCGLLLRRRRNAA